MNIGGGEAADQLVRMMLSGSEVAVRLSGSALKNVLALRMALAKNHKTISGKVNLAKMLREKKTYLEIAEKTGASTATISRVNRSLNYGNDGYDMVFRRLESKKEN